MTLIERRAEFIYNAARLAAIAADCPVIPVPWDERESAFQDQFVQVIKKECSRERCSDPKKLHEDWVVAYRKMGWVYGEIYDPKNKTHPDMVPYAELGRLERDKDAVFVELCHIARLYILPVGV